LGIRLHAERTVRIDARLEPLVRVDGPLEFELGPAVREPVLAERTDDRIDAPSVHARAADQCGAEAVGTRAAAGMNRIRRIVGFRIHHPRLEAHGRGDHTTPRARKSMIAAWSQPSSRRISSVCCPSRGGSPRTRGPSLSPVTKPAPTTLMRLPGLRGEA